MIETFLDDLNPAQREAVLHTEGPLLVLAGAGSGKTRVITRRIAHIVARKLAKPSHILAVTFTNKAAEEMRDRVGELVGAKTAQDIMLTTFHAFCVRVLRAHIHRIGYRKDFSICGEGDARTLVRRILGDLDGVRETFSPQRLQSAISLHKNGCDRPPPFPVDDKIPADTEAKYRAWLPEFIGRYQSALRAANSLDFDDLLALTLELWRKEPDLLAKFQQHYRYVLVDEYQDTNRIQYDLLRAIAEPRRNLCVVGDDDQSIYGWRGAEPAHILAFDRDYPDARVITLDQNYRSTETILSAANAVIANNAERRAKNLWSTLGAGRPIEWIVAGDEEHEARAIMQWLTHIQKKTDAACGDFAVLYRSNLQSRPIEMALRQAGIPYVVVGGQEFFERAEVKDILAYLKLAANPRNETAFLRVVNVPRRGIGDAALHRIHDLCGNGSLSIWDASLQAVRRGLVEKNAAAGLESFHRIIETFRKRFRQPDAPLRAIAEDLLDAIAYRAEIGRTSRTPQQFEQRWGNAEAVLRAIEIHEQSAKAPSLAGFLDENALDGDDDRQSREKRREDAVTLMTIHSAKGLEFPFVFIAGCEEGLIPHDRSLRENGIEEERRLFYVALTRAKRHVTVFEALARNRFGRICMTKTSRFLGEIPSELVRRRVLAAREMVESAMTPMKTKPRRKRRPRPLA
ncbi:MAG TPA: UvrD-helicase domain-containing protein [Candidatus Hydrogenedentes bacterium]|nr:UvrD-helicase domain-containing protein [Candidatus Hydrogenedentota bacterium]HOV74400.1 UvrD-helicase domain-containing protein [Candidatus Hydrogenedentota bacterium]